MGASILARAVQYGKKAYNTYAKANYITPTMLAAIAASSRNQRLGLPSTSSNGSSSKKVHSGQGVTTQYDKTIMYRKRRMPRKKRKRWVRYLRKNLAADMQLLGTKTFVFNHSITRIAAVNSQDISGIHLYGFTSAQGDPAQIQLAEIGYRDVQRIMDSFLAGDPASPRVGAYPGSKMVFGSAVLDLTIAVTGPAGDPVQGGASGEIDVYEIVYRKSTVDPAIHGLRLMYDTGSSNQDPTLPGTTWNNFFTRGWTPFDTPQAISQYGIKILKKTKLFLAPGNTATYQIRDARNRYIDLSDADQTQGLARKGYTRSLLIVQKPVVGSTASLRVAYGCTRKYMIKITKSGSTDQSQGLIGAG